MAILKHIPVKNRFYSQAVEYLTCRFDEYTNKPLLDEQGRITERYSYLIEGVNCDTDTFCVECIETNRYYGKNNAVNDVKAHHYIISFDPADEISMEEALVFGKKWLSVFAPGHQAVVAVHPDGHNGSKNMHVHVVFNSVRKYTGIKSEWHYKPCEYKQGCKHRSTGRMMHHAKKWVMEECIKRGLEQVNLLAKKHTDNYWVERRLVANNSRDGIGATSNREIIRNTIDRVIPSVETLEQLVKFLTEVYGWKVRITNKTITFTMPDMKQGIRGSKLGEGYGKAELIERIDESIRCRTEEKARVEAEARKVAEAKRKAEEAARAKAEAEAMAEKAAEENRRAELLEKKKKLAQNRNDIKNSYFNELANAKEWNAEYSDYLLYQVHSDYVTMSVEELSEPVLTREEFEEGQKLQLQETIKQEAKELWEYTLDNVNGNAHRWKWDYMNYLEDICYRDVNGLTLQEVKMPILSLEEFTVLKEAEEKENSVEIIDMAAEVTDKNVVELNHSVESVDVNDFVETDIPLEKDNPTETVSVVEEVSKEPQTIEELAHNIADTIRKYYGSYGNLTPENKAKLFKFVDDDLKRNFELHRLVLEKLAVKMTVSDAADDFMAIDEATDRMRDDTGRGYGNKSRDGRTR